MTEQQINYLARLHSGQWFGFDGEQAYKNLWVKGFDKPTLEEIEQGVKDYEESKHRQGMRTESWRLFEVLEDEGHLDGVKTLVKESHKKVKKAFARAPYIRRNSKTVKAFQAELGLTDEELDSLFEKANKIEI